MTITLSAEQQRHVLVQIAMMVKDQLALAEHYQTKDDFQAIRFSQADAFEHIAKLLSYYVPEIKPMVLISRV